MKNWSRKKVSTYIENIFGAVKNLGKQLTLLIKSILSIYVEFWLNQVLVKGHRDTRAFPAAYGLLC